MILCWNSGCFLTKLWADHAVAVAQLFYKTIHLPVAFPLQYQVVVLRLRIVCHAGWYFVVSRSLREKKHL